MSILLVAALVVPAHANPTAVLSVPSVPVVRPFEGPQVAMSWPLCGRITEAPPAGWSEAQGCPASRVDNAAFGDFPLSATYGPRRRSRPSPAYEWHRGIDIPTTCGTPIFAVADGVVRVAGNHPSYQSRMMRIRHGDQACGFGCLHTEYQHVADVAVAEGDTVQQGQLIGWTGYFGIGRGPVTSVADECARPHGGTDMLHFEVKQAPTDDRFSTWARDAQHPMHFLPYLDRGAQDMEVRIDRVDLDDPLNPKVQVRVLLPNNGELDLASVSVTLYDNSTGRPIPQQGDVDGPHGYPVLPTTVDFTQMNGAYTHKNSSAYPWESFDSCPFAGQHGPSYQPDVHLMQTHPGSPQLS